MTNSSPLVDQLKILGRVQELDIQLDEINREIGAFPETLKSLRDQLAKLEASLVARFQAHDVKDRSIKQVLASLEINKEQLERATGRIQDVENTKEFGAATKEVDQLKRHAQDLTAQKARLELEIEPLRVERQTVLDKIAVLKASIETESARQGSQTRELEVKKSDLAVQRKEVLGQTVPPSLLSRYDRIRSARGGRGLTSALGGRCEACHMVIPPHLCSLVAKGIELCDCPSCNRIFISA